MWMQRFLYARYRIDINIMLCKSEQNNVVISWLRVASNHVTTDTSRFTMNHFQEVITCPIACRFLAEEITSLI